MADPKIILNYWRYMKIPEVDYHLDKLNYDKLTFNYLEYPEPYIQLDKFKEHIDEYDYIVIVTNDVIVKQENMDVLLEDLQCTFNDEKPYVLCGCFNVDIDENFDYLNICYDIPTKEYNWIHKENKTGYQRVEFAGFPLMAIHKDIFKQYQFTGSHFSGDRRFCIWCKEHGIPIWCNFDNRMLHLRYYGEKPVNKTQSVEWRRIVS